jgi:hypothetical protein
MLTALHREPGLLDKIAARRNATTTPAPSPTPAPAPSAEANEDATFAKSLLAWLRMEVASTVPQIKLFPVGFIIHQPLAEDLDALERRRGMAADAFVAGVDPEFYDQIMLSGTSMWSSHMPQSYAAVLLGDLHAPYVPRGAAGF